MSLTSKTTEPPNNPTISPTISNPPAYGEPTNETWDPTILILNDTTIHAESPSTTPLYRLSRAVSKITSSTKEVTLSQITHSIKSASDEPLIKPRSRDIYTIKYAVDVPGGLGARVDGFTFPKVYIQSASRGKAGNGNLGIKHSRFRLKRGLKVVEIDFSKKGSNWGLPSFVKDAKPKFEIQPKDDGAGEWTDGDGKPVAVEDRRDGQHKLVITKALPRDTVDVLVALWCGRVWQYSDENTKPVDEGLEGVRRKFRLAQQIQPTSKTMAGFGV